VPSHVPSKAQWVSPHAASTFIPLSMPTPQYFLGPNFRALLLRRQFVPMFLFSTEASRAFFLSELFYILLPSCLILVCFLPSESLPRRVTGGVSPPSFDGSTIFLALPPLDGIGPRIRKEGRLIGRSLSFSSSGAKEGRWNAARGFNNPPDPKGPSVVSLALFPIFPLPQGGSTSLGLRDALVKALTPPFFFSIHAGFFPPHSNYISEAMPKPGEVEAGPPSFLGRFRVTFFVLFFLTVAISGLLLQGAAAFPRGKEE